MIQYPSKNNLYVRSLFCKDTATTILYSYSKNDACEHFKQASKLTDTNPIWRHKHYEDNIVTIFDVHGSITGTERCVCERLERTKYNFLLYLILLHVML